ncbi:MAG: ligase-associated DNA damage response DEXH box helicase [Caldilineaceae bacterium]|nr:ligase-associated DNA damage response DEXH box helicase [Caldilineaceae bacterium]
MNLFTDFQGLSLIEGWFGGRGWSPFPFQRETWTAYADGGSGLLHAPTGQGKTYAVWLGPLMQWIDAHPVRENWGKMDAPPLQVLWLTPLRALAADTTNAIQAPIRDLGIPWTVERRTGDVSSSVKARQNKRLPSALVTTPESLSLLISRRNADELFGELQAVVVDEWHELLGSKRGTQTELCLAWLRRRRPDLRTWGLSATLGNLDVALDALVGVPSAERSQRKTFLITGHAPKEIVIDSLIPDEIERFPWSGHLGLKMLPQVVAAIEEGESCLVFTNTRSQAETWYQAILDAVPDWAGLIALHHGSLDPQVREWVEDGLRRGMLRCVVATSSLDLGVDFSPVDRVLQVGSPKGVARLLQRAGRSGHRPGAVSRVTCVPTHAFELIEVAGARTAALAGAIEGRAPPEKPLDVLVQHLVTLALGSGFRYDDTLAEVRSTYAFRNLSDDEWDWALGFVVTGGDALTSYPEYQRVVAKVDDDAYDDAHRDYAQHWQGPRYVVEDRKVAQRHRLNVGTIVSEVSVQVQYVNGGKLGSVDEYFISRLEPGDRFIFAGRVLEFVNLREMTAYVRKAKSSRGAIPRWMGSRMPLSTALAAAVREKLEAAAHGVFEDVEMRAVEPILALQAAGSRIPRKDELLIEQVETDEGYHLFFYPFEGRLVHEGMAALFAYRLSRLRPITFSMAVNDYGLNLLAADPIPLAEMLAGEGTSPLFSTANLFEDIPASLNAAEMARRQFREIAQIAGLVSTGLPGQRVRSKHLQASSNLFFDVFSQYDAANLLLTQAHREVLEQQLEQSRMAQALKRIGQARIVVKELRRPSPLSFPLLVDRWREEVSSESLADRVRKMQIAMGLDED